MRAMRGRRASRRPSDVAAVPRGILHDGLAADLVESDGLRAFAGGGAMASTRRVSRETRWEHSAKHAGPSSRDDGVELVHTEVIRAAAFGACTMSRW